MQEIAMLPEKDEKQVELLGWLKGFTVQTNEDFTKLDQMCVQAKVHEKRGEDLFRSAIEEAYALHKGLCSKLKGYVSAAVEFRTLAKQKMDIWNRAQEEARRKEEARLQSEAAKLADDQAIRDAEAMEAQGFKDVAETILSTPVAVAPVVIPKSVPKATTVIRRIPDQKLLAEAVAKGVRDIPGVSIFPVWSFKVVQPSMVPEIYKRAS